ncbi:C-GCAxxG-C-C family (seleno)protein [Lentisphaerota bacterium WC36G]|nr:C-GCAxxG-C-C family protein [Lentisphaerae bacterium WC36]
MSDYREKAVKAFTEDKMSCGQSILKGFQELYDIKEDEILDAKAFGGGRAEGGLCGALYCGKMLCKTDVERDELTTEFTSKTQYAECKAIKQNKTASCTECVDQAAKILEEIAKKRK